MFSRLRSVLFCTALRVALAAPLIAGSGASPTAGGAVTVSQTSEPKTLNPVLAADQPTRDVLSIMWADLIHINRRTLATESALAERCTISPDGRRYTVLLRDGLRFSDGAPLTADDVVFTFTVYLDARVNSPQRDLLLINGRPIAVTKVSARIVRFDLPAPYAPGERIFDSFWILPKHKLAALFAQGRFTEAWTIGSSPAELATTGPFRLAQYVPGQRLVFEKNPNYWKRDENGQPLPYLDRLDIVFVADQNAQLVRLMARDVAAGARLRADDVATLQRSPFLTVRDAGPSLEYNFLFFNWSAAPPLGDWVRSLKFRQAIAHGIDRASIVRLVYQGRGTAIASQVTPGNRLWQTDAVSQYAYDPARATALLQEAGFRRDASGALFDRANRRVELSLMVSASNQPRRKMATLIQDDLARLGIDLRVQPTEFGVMLDTVLKTRRFDAALWGVASGDADPNADMNVWTSTGTLHVWNLAPASGAPRLEPWEAEIDRLMAAQMTATDFGARKASYDRVQQLVSANLPVIFLASPHVLAAADKSLGNFEPAATEPVVLWNAERWFWPRPRS
jgi:peptide/nickel transport system substrate-binding protein